MPEDNIVIPMTEYKKLLRAQAFVDLILSTDYGNNTAVTETIKEYYRREAAPAETVEEHFCREDRV